MQKNWFYICFLLFMAYGQLSGASVLGLFKSHEGTTALENEIRWHLEGELRSLGLSVAYHDMDQGVPDVDAKTSLVISWYRGPEMKGAETYTRWLKAQALKGVRVLVMGNYGAFMDLDQKNWLSMDMLNDFFHVLGFDYRNQWTSQENVIKCVDSHPLLLGEARSLIFRRPSYYVQFLATQPESTLKLATLNRTDLKEGDSHVIAITQRGGLALHPYLFAQQDGKFLYAFDRKRFLQLVLNYTGSQKGNQVMCLFKSEDGQTKTENEIKWHIEPFLGKTKTLIYHDASASIPSLELSEQADVFITWFRGSSMPEAKAYLQWLSSRAYLGSKILIFGNMGAFQDGSSKAWLTLNEVNLLYDALGLEYGGQWTGEATLIEHVHDQSEFFHLSMESMAKRIHHYQKVELKHPAGKSLLMVKRNDLENSQSSLIAITPFGAYAEGPYLFYQHKSTVEPLLKLELFVPRVLGTQVSK